ncbi:hypothetical protein RCO27_17750 [Sphingosinicella sp. LHD-64]|uniref:hypothetical protein n=1 Tax=Sphingosinicella sp. LHD-64 TaxID=3072139 RepID=UPI00280F3471|nr:hypothetical protein [Sphingosinicella sp. LHD-64]MDQ8758075.1 hypothetical protein [Sphingosinicella sp. LHD-64]
MTIDGELDVGKTLKGFARDFDQELRARNAIHHHDQFDDLAIQGIGIATMMGTDERVGPGWQLVARIGYRRSSREWAERVKRRSKDVEHYLDAVAKAMLEHCTFLDEPVDSQETKKKAV